MSGGGVKFTWMIRLADCSDGQMLRERGKHDTQLAKIGGAAQDVPTQIKAPSQFQQF